MKTVEKKADVVSFLKGKVQSHSLEAALMIASYLHRGIKDKGGRSYICHPLWIYGQITAKCGSLDEQIVAILHDVYEDSPITLHELEEWFSPTVCVAIDAISKRVDEDGETYIRRVAMDPIARKVKKEDLRHNMDITRLKNRGKMTQKDLDRLADYAHKYDFLCGGLHNV